MNILTFVRNLFLATAIWAGLLSATAQRSSASEPEENQLIDFFSIIQITFQKNLEIVIELDVTSGFYFKHLGDLVKEIGEAYDFNHRENGS